MRSARLQLWTIARATINKTLFFKVHGEFCGDLFGGFSGGFSLFDGTGDDGGAFGVVGFQHGHECVVAGAQGREPGADGRGGRDFRIERFKRFEHAGDNGVFLLKVELRGGACLLLPNFP